MFVIQTEAASEKEDLLMNRSRARASVETGSMPSFFSHYIV